MAKLIVQNIGDVSLENLELKKGALEHLELPFTVKEGTLCLLRFVRVVWVMVRC